MRSSFGAHESRPGGILPAVSTPPRMRTELRKMGYDLTFEEQISGSMNAIFFDREQILFGAAQATTGKTTELRSNFVEGAGFRRVRQPKRRLKFSEDEAYGLDASNVAIEKTPVVVSEPTKVKLVRTQK